MSIGYFTCHWCHVMERESFSDQKVAALLNQYFVAIKVDREERPDIDQVYMTVTQTLTGRGELAQYGFFNPRSKAFFRGHLFSKENRWGKTGLIELLPKVAEIWQNDRENVLKSADQITDLIASRHSPSAGTALDKAILAKTHNMLAEIYDVEYGGFGPAPKFPTPMCLDFYCGNITIQKKVRPWLWPKNH